MTATARTHGAVTVVNAIPAGGGAAIGVDFDVTARVDLAETVEVEAKAPGGEVDDDLVRAVADVVLPAGQGARIDVDSEIPVGRGLKSSSAVANAVALALVRALDRDDALPEVIRLGVEGARRAGVTTTGAFDDACASMLGGVCVTDNDDDRLLARHRAPDLGVVVAVPEERKSEAAVDPDSYAEHRRLFETAHRWALDGSWQAAFGLNATGVASSLDLDADPVLDMLAAGAVAAGPSGTGPALAALAPSERVEAVRDAAAGTGWEVQVREPVEEVAR